MSVRVRLIAAERGRDSRVEVEVADDEWFDISRLVKGAQVTVDPGSLTVVHLDMIGGSDAIGRLDDDTLEGLADIIDEHRRRDLLPPPRA